jgi:PAS domain S-box-containing protein/putative nucleotidyltransferase with HDIG domain
VRCGWRGADHPSAPGGWGGYNSGVVNHEVAQFAQLLDALACGAAMLERSGRIVHVNPRAAALLGRDARALLGQPVQSLYPDAEAQAFIAAALADMDAPREGEFYLPTPAGDKVPVVISGRSWRDSTGARAYYAMTMTDITPLKEAEADLKNRYRIIAELSNTILGQAENLKDYNDALEHRVHERTQELHEANMDAIYMLAVASESKDQDTGDHVRRLQHYSRSLARELGFSPRESEQIGYSAILHDVGKIHVPDHILKKPGPLTEDERAAIQEHTTAGEHILSTKPFFNRARKIARSHHENHDGSGYPDRAGGEDIPIEARIVQLADVYDALTTPRVYKRAWDTYDAASIIEESAGKMFDPDVVKAFTSLKARQSWQRDAVSKIPDGLVSISATSNEGVSQ